MAPLVYLLLFLALVSGTLSAGYSDTDSEREFVQKELHSDGFRSRISNSMEKAMMASLDDKFSSKDFDIASLGLSHQLREQAQLMKYIFLEENQGIVSNIDNLAHLREGDISNNNNINNNNNNTGDKYSKTHSNSSAIMLELGSSVGLLQHQNQHQNQSLSSTVEPATSRKGSGWGVSPPSLKGAFQDEGEEPREVVTKKTFIEKVQDKCVSLLASLVFGSELADMLKRSKPIYSFRVSHFDLNARLTTRSDKSNFHIHSGLKMIYPISTASFEHRTLFRLPFGSDAKSSHPIQVYSNRLRHDPLKRNSYELTMPVAPDQNSIFNMIVIDAFFSRALYNSWKKQPSPTFIGIWAIDSRGRACTDITKPNTCSEMQGATSLHNLNRGSMFQIDNVEQDLVSQSSKVHPKKYNFPLVVNNHPSCRQNLLRDFQGPRLYEFSMHECGMKVLPQTQRFVALQCRHSRPGPLDIHVPYVSRYKCYSAAHLQLKKQKEEDGLQLDVMQMMKTEITRIDGRLTLFFPRPTEDDEVGEGKEEEKEKEKEKEEEMEEAIEDGVGDMFTDVDSVISDSDFSSISSSSVSSLDAAAKKEQEEKETEEKEAEEAAKKLNELFREKKEEEMLFKLNFDINAIVNLDIKGSVMGGNHDRFGMGLDFAKISAENYDDEESFNQNPYVKEASYLEHPPSWWNTLSLGHKTNIQAGFTCALRTIYVRLQQPVIDYMQSEYADPDVYQFHKREASCDFLMNESAALHKICRLARDTCHDTNVGFKVSACAALPFKKNVPAAVEESKKDLRVTLTNRVGMEEAEAQKIVADADKWANEIVRMIDEGETPVNLYSLHPKRNALQGTMPETDSGCVDAMLQLSWYVRERWKGVDDRRRLRSIKKSWRCNHAETNPEKQCYLTLGQCVPLPGAPMEDAPQRCMSRNAQTCTADDDNCMWNWNVKVDVLSSSTDIPLARVSYYSDVKEYKKMRIVQALVAAANSLGGTVGRFLRRSFSGVFSQTIQEAIRYKGHGVAPDSRTFSLPLFNFMGIFDNMFYSRVREYEETARKNVEELMFNSSTEAEMVGKDIVTLLGNNPGIVIDTEIAVRHVRQRLLRSLVYIYSRLISQTKSMMVNDGTDEDKSLLTPLELEDLMNINADCDLLVDIEEEEEAIANLDFETDDISLADDQLIGSMANRRPSTKMHQIALEAVKDGMVGGVKAVPGALHGLLDHTEWGISNIPLVGEHAGRAIKPMVDTVRKNVLPERAGEKKKGRDIVEGTWSDVDSVGGKKDEVSGRSTMKQLPHPFSKAFASKTNPFAKALNGKHTPHALKLADFKARHQARADSGDGDSVLSDLTQDDAPATMQGRGRSDSDSDSEGANDEDWRSVSSESSGLTELTFLELNTTMEKREKRVVASATSTGDDSDNSAGDESGLYDSEDLSVQTPESRQDANTLRSTRTALSSRSSADQTSSAVGQSISSKAINDFRTDAVTRAKTKGLLNFLLPDDDESDKEDTSSVGDEPIASASRRTTAQGVDGSETGKVMSGDMNGDGMSNYLNFPRDTKIHADKITIRQMDYDMSATYRVEIDIIFLSENMNYDLNDKTLAKEVRLKMEEAALSTTSDQKYLLMGDVFKVRPAQCSNGLVFEKEHCRKIITGITPTMVNGHSTLVIDEGVDFLYPLTILDALLVPYRIARSFMFRVAVYKEPSIIRGAIRSEFLHAASFPMLHMYDTDEDNQDDVMDMGSLRMNKQYKYERLGNFLKVSRYLLVFTEEIVVQSVLRFDYQFKEAKQKNVAKINNVLGENDYRTGVIPAMSGFPFLKPVFPYLHLSDINMQFNTFDLKISIESGPPLCASARELDEDISPFDTAENVAADIREEQERHGKKGTVSPIQILQGVKKKKKANRKLGSDAIFSADGSSSSEEGVEDLFSDERSETASACPNPDDAKRHQVVVSLTDLSIDLYIRLHITKGDRVLYSARACHVVVTSDFFSFFLQPDYSSDSKDEVLISYHVQHTPFKYKWRSAPWYVWNIKKTQTFLESNLDIGIKNLILKFLLRQVFPTAPGVRKSNTRVLAGPSVLLMKVLIATDEKIDSLKAEGKDVAASQQDAHASITLSTYDLPLRNDQTHELPMLLANLNQILLLSGISLGSDAIVPKDSEFKTNPAELEDGAELSGDMGEGGVSTMFDVWDQLG